MNWELEIPRVAAQVRLGVGLDERASPQDIEVGLKLCFDQAPVGCVTDRIDDVVCYAQLCDWIGDICRQENFALVERLTERLREALSTELARAGRPARVSVWVHKLQPPHPALRGGAVFRIQA